MKSTAQIYPAYCGPRRYRPWCYSLAHCLISRTA